MTHWTNWSLHCPNKKSHCKHKYIIFCRNQFYYFYFLLFGSIWQNNHKQDIREELSFPTAHKHQWVRCEGFQACQPNSYSTVEELTNVRCSEPAEWLYVCSLPKSSDTFICSQRTDRWQTSCRQVYSVFHISLAISSARWNQNKISACPTTFRWMIEHLGSFVSTLFWTATEFITGVYHRQVNTEQLLKRNQFWWKGLLDTWDFDSQKE